MQILQKFDGVTESEFKTYKENFIKRYEILKLPKYLIMCFRVGFFFYMIKSQITDMWPIRHLFHDQRKFLF